MNRLTRIGAAAALAAVSVLAFSQAPNQDKTAIETRQAVFKLIANQFGPVGAAMRGGSLDKNVAALNGARIESLAGMIPELFARDTRQYKDAPTKALDGIWSSQADFKAKADALVSAANALAAAGKAGDSAAITKASGDMGRACGSCHDSFRAK